MIEIFAVVTVAYQSGFMTVEEKETTVAAE